MASTGQAAASPVRPAGMASVAASHSAGVQPKATNQLDCNGYSTKYQALRSGSQMECTDPIVRHG